MLTMKRISLLLVPLAILALLVAFHPGPALADSPLGITVTPTEPGPTETPVTPPPTDTPEATPTEVSPTETAQIPTPTPTIEVRPPGSPTPTPTDEPPERPERPRPTSEAVVLPQTGDLPLDPPGGSSGSGVLTALFIALIGAMLLGFTMGDRIRRWFASLGIFGTVLVLGLLAYALLQMAVQTSIAASLQAPASTSLSAPAGERVASSPAEAGSVASTALLGVVAAQPLTGAAVLVRKEVLGAQPALKSRDLTAVQRVVIPALAVDSDVKVAPLEKGTWNITGLRDRVAWLAKTSAPGEGGNTVLAGHIRVRYIGDGPFRYLDRLEPGQEVVVYTLENMYTYRVREQLVVGIEDVHVTTEVGQPQITLLTCTDWDEDAESYRNRRAVIADLVSVASLLDARIQ